MNHQARSRKFQGPARPALETNHLTHFPTRRLYADLNASKAFGFSVVIYHVKGDGEASLNPLDKYPNRSDIEPIMFLSRMHAPAETRYWPTELEVAGLVLQAPCTRVSHSRQTENDRTYD
jgi:hypothetical protein